MNTSALLKPRMSEKPFSFFFLAIMNWCKKMKHTLKKGVEPVLRIDEETFHEQLSDPSIFGGEGKYWGLPENAFRKDPQKGILLKSEYATLLEWKVDEYREEIGMVNINVVGHPTRFEGMNVGAFCSWVHEDDLEH